MTDSCYLVNPCNDCDKTEILRHFYTPEGECRCDDYYVFIVGKKAQIRLLEYIIKNGSTYIARDGLKLLLKDVKEEGE